jgi:hypothetical protein
MCILYNQRDATYITFFIIISALHVSDGPSAHHQEPIKLYLQPWILSCFPAAYRCCGCVGTSSNSLSNCQLSKNSYPWTKGVMGDIDTGIINGFSWRRMRCSGWVLWWLLYFLKTGNYSSYQCLSLLLIFFILTENTGCKLRIQATSCNATFEARLCNHCCRGKAILHILSECV